MEIVGLISLTLKLIVVLLFVASLIQRLVSLGTRQVAGLLTFPVATMVATTVLGGSSGVDGGWALGTFGGLLAAGLLLITGLSVLPTSSTGVEPSSGAPKSIRTAPPGYLPALVIAGVAIGLIGFAYALFGGFSDGWRLVGALLPFLFGCVAIFVVVGIERPAFGVLLVVLVVIGTTYAAKLSYDRATTPTYEMTDEH
ncbi:MAG TPA: hypothetical protein PLI18_11425 [Pirellulaceae bacterium]|nr:hypothetical protein [Pirellulaceae bacterium]